MFNINSFKVFIIELRQFVNYVVRKKYFGFGLNHVYMFIHMSIYTFIYLFICNY